MRPSQGVEPRTEPGDGRECLQRLLHERGRAHTAVTDRRDEVTIGGDELPHGELRDVALQQLDAFGRADPGAGLRCKGASVDVVDEQDDLRSWSAMVVAWVHVVQDVTDVGNAQHHRVFAPLLDELTE